MDFTKITPIEYNGQRVAPTIYLVDFVSNEQDRGNAKTSINAHARRMVAAKVKIQPTAKPAIKPAEIIREVGATSDAIQRVYKVKDGIALAQATNMIEQYYGQDLSSLKKLIPPAEHATGYLNATELGQKVGMSARTLNNRLEVIKWQRKDKNSDWRLTDEGKQYGEEMPYTRNGHSGYQIRWSEKAVDFITENAPSLF